MSEQTDRNGAFVGGIMTARIQAVGMLGGL